MAAAGEKNRRNKVHLENMRKFLAMLESQKEQLAKIADDENCQEILGLFRSLPANLTSEGAEDPGYVSNFYTRMSEIISRVTQENRLEVRRFIAGLVIKSGLVNFEGEEISPVRKPVAEGIQGCMAERHGNAWQDSQTFDIGPTRVCAKGT